MTSYRLPYEQLDYVLSFVINIHYDTSVEFPELMEEFDAVFSFTGLTKPHWRKGKNTRWCYSDIGTEGRNYGKDPSAGQWVAMIVTATRPPLG